MAHQCVRTALEADGWQITHDPYNLTATRRDGKKVGVPIDLGAERIFAAEKSGEKIAVEVKIFLRASVVNEFHRAVGQYLMCRVGLSECFSGSPQAKRQIKIGKISRLGLLIVSKI